MNSLPKGENSWTRGRGLSRTCFCGSDGHHNGSCRVDIGIFVYVCEGGVGVVVFFFLMRGDVVF